MDISGVAEAFAAAPFQVNGWDSALKLMASATGSARGQLLAMGDRHLNFNWCTDVDEAYYSDFAAIEGYRADVNWRIAAMGKPFEVTHEAHYDVARAVSTNEAYLDHARRFDAEFGAQVVLTDRPDRFFGIASLHSASDGRTSEADRRALLAAAPHVVFAVRAQIAIEHQGVELLRGSLAAVRVAAILLDACGRFCALTPAAEAVLASGAFRCVQGLLAAAAPAYDRALQARIAAALAQRTPPASDLWVRAGGQCVLVEAFALPRGDWSFGFAPAVVVTFRAPVPIGRDDAARLAATLRLTPAEGEVVALLASGLSRTAIAAARGTSVATVISQLRAIFGKCDVGREAELVALAAAILGAR